MRCKNKRFFHAYFSDNYVTKTAQKRELGTYPNSPKIFIQMAHTIGQQR